MDIKAYLDRINYHGSLAPAAETLRALQVAHLLAVPFENLSIHNGEPIVLEDDALFTKIVRNRRGGFCYEANGLFSALLRELGFEVTMLAAEVANADGEFGPNFDHMTLMVTLAERWLVDVGFGDSFLEPLLLDERGEQVQGSWEYRIVSNGAYLVLMRRNKKPESQSDNSLDARAEAGAEVVDEQPDLDTEWKTEYRFSLQPYRYADYAEMCRYHQTSPQSHFTRSRICSRATEDGRITLSDMRFITTKRSGDHQLREERILTSQDEYAGILRDQFGIVMEV